MEDRLLPINTLLGLLLPNDLGRPALLEAGLDLLAELDAGDNDTEDPDEQEVGR